MLGRLGASVYRARWAVIAFWLVITIGAAFIAPRITSVLHGGGTRSATASLRSPTTFCTERTATAR